MLSPAERAGKRLLWILKLWVLDKTERGHQTITYIQRQAFHSQASELVGTLRVGSFREFVSVRV